MGFQLPKTQSLSLVVLLGHCLAAAWALFGNKKRQEEEEAARLAAEAAAAAATDAPMDIDDSNITFVVSCLLVLLTIVFVFYPSSTKDSLENKGNRPNQKGTLDVVIVGVGMPKKGMGWYHLTQLLEMTNVNLVAVVEPFFLNPELCKNVPPGFKSFKEETSALGVQFVKSVADLDEFVKPTLCLIAGRTMDNPRFFKECLEKGATGIFLEKPGAPSVVELEDMKTRAEIMGTKVYIGYNKNVTPYVQKALELKTDKTQVTFVHNNSYKKEELSECFTRNAEGMLKNMAVHELALLVTFFGVTVDTIDKFKVLKDVSEKLKLPKFQSSGEITDFPKVGFEVTTKAGTVVTVMANRCGGNVSHALVKDASSGKTLGKFEFPDAATQAKVEEQTKNDPDMMPYFFVQSDDYLELKNRVVTACLTGTEAKGVATISIAIDALKLAEYGTKILLKEL